MAVVDVAHDVVGDARLSMKQKADEEEDDQQ
jgi:hypothetical protein